LVVLLVPDVNVSFPGFCEPPNAVRSRIDARDGNETTQIRRSASVT